MLKLKCLITAIFTAQVLFAVDTPCIPHGGKPLPWEGSGLCTGNNQLTIPLDTAALGLIYNSIESEKSYGFGDANWRLSVDHRLIDERSTASKVTLDQADGTKIEYAPQSSGKWKAASYLSKSKLYMQGALWVEELQDGSLIKYQLISNNIYGSVSISNSQGNTTTITRNLLGQITKVRNHFGKEIVISYLNERAEKVKDFQGKYYEFSYLNNTSSSLPSAQKFLTEVALPDGSGWAISYENNFTTGSRTNVTRLTDPSGSYQEFSYYPKFPPYQSGILQSVKDGSSFYTLISYTQDSVNVQTQKSNDTEYYNSGKLVRSLLDNAETIYIRQADGLPSLVTNSIGQTSAFSYDAGLNLKSIVSSDGTSTDFINNLNGNPITVVEKKGSTNVQSVAYTYDSKSRILSITPNIGDDVLYQRDANGNIIKITQAGDEVQSFTYDANSLLTSKTDLILDLTTSYIYVNGFLVSVKDPLGYETHYSNNALGQPLRVVNSDGTVRTLQYDELGRNTIDRIDGPSRSPYFVTTTHEILRAPINAGFIVKRAKVIEASFNFVPLFSKILPWKVAHAESWAPAIGTATSRSASTGESSRSNSNNNGNSISSTSDSIGNTSDLTCETESEESNTETCKWHCYYISAPEDDGSVGCENTYFGAFSSWEQCPATIFNGVCIFDKDKTIAIGHECDL